MAHSIPWDWRVSLYTWTKGIASGVYLVAALLVLFGFLRDDDPTWVWATPVVSGAFLGITGLLLIWDLEHPARFYMIFTRAQWRSWLVKGAFIIAGYSLVLALHFVASIAGSTSIQRWLIIGGIHLSSLTAIYTAYLFAQAKARDLWQNPLATATFACSGSAARLCDTDAFVGHVGFPRLRYFLFNSFCRARLDARSGKPAPRHDCDRRSLAHSCHGPRAACNLGDDARSLQKRFLGGAGAFNNRRRVAIRGAHRISVRGNAGFAARVDWDGALRTRVRAGGTISATCLTNKEVR